MDDLAYQDLQTLLRRQSHGDATPRDMERLRRLVARWELNAYRLPDDHVIRLAWIALGMEYFLRLAEDEQRSAA